MSVDFIPKTTHSNMLFTYHLDLSYLNAVVGADNDVRKTILSLIVKEFDESIPLLRQLFQQRKWEELSRTCHHFKSTLDFTGSRILLDANRNIWDCANSGGLQMSAAADCLQQLEAHSEAVKAEVRQLLDEL